MPISAGFGSSQEVVRPRGVSLTLDNQFFVVSHGENEHDVVRFATETLEPVPGSAAMESFISGSHVITHRKPA